MSIRTIIANVLAAAVLPAAAAAQSTNFAVLHANDYRHYVTRFAADELEATGKSPADEWPWMQANIPLFDASDKQFEEMYYFRWYAWEKHLVATRAAS